MKPVYIIRCKAILFFAFQLLNSSSFGQANNDYRSAISGSWGNIITWERYNGTAWVQPTALEGVPNNTDGVITIRNGHTITVAANLSIDDAIINAGGQITVNSGITLTIANGTGTDLVVNGTLQNNNIITTTGTLSFGASSTYTHSRNGGTIPTATWNVTSTCNVTGVTGTVPGGLSQTFGNFTWDCIGQTSNILFNGNLNTVNGNLTVGNTNVRTLSLASANNSTYTLAILGNLIVNDNAWLAITNGDNITATVNVGGNFIMSGVSSNSTFFSYHLATGGSITLNKIILNVSGNFSQTGGYFDFADGDSDSPNFTELRLGGDFSVTNTGIVSTSTSDNSITNGLIQFNKTGTQQYTVTTPANISFTNFVIAANSILQLNSNISLTSSLTIVWGGTLTVNSGGTLDAGTNQVLSSTGASAGSNNIFALNSGGAVITANSNGVQSGTSGTVSTSLATETFSSAANYIFKSSVTGTFTTTPTAATVNNFTVDRSGGVSMSQSIAVNGAFTLTSGILTTTLTNILIINDNATSTAGSATSYVSGPMRKTGNDAFTFPVGKSGVYAPISISAPGSVTDAFRAEYIRGSGSALGSITAPGLVRVSNCEYWNLDRTAGTASVNVTLSWSNQSPCNAAAYVDDLATLTVAHFNGSNWDSHGNSGGTTGNLIAGTVTRNGVSVFSPFTLGSTSNVTNPLPVKFGNISGFIKGAGVQIEWKVYSEENVKQYEIERSSNNGSFSTIGSVNAINQNTEISYSFFDGNPLAAIGLYRIKSIDYDGKFIYSTIIRITQNNTYNNAISIYPNPVKGEYISVQLANLQKGSYTIKIIASNGQAVFGQQYLHNGGPITQGIPLPPAIKAGMYVLCMENNGMRISSKSFIIQ